MIGFRGPVYLGWWPIMGQVMLVVMKAALKHVQRTDVGKSDVDSLDVSVVEITIFIKPVVWQCVTSKGIGTLLN